ncbi:MAG: hypothetical protein Q9184_003647 [Pyrenodesmia sp. 2 TL-2023]
MELLEARMFLLRHLRLDLEPVPQDIQENCDKIAERLGYLALAIDLAGAYIGNETDQRQAPRQFLADYARHRDDLLQSEHTRGLSASDKTVWTVWDMTLEKIERHHVDLRPGWLLAFLARFSDGVVQDELFRLASPSISSVTREMYDETAELPEWLAKLLAFDGKEWNADSRKLGGWLGIDDARMPFVWRTVGRTYLDEGRWKKAEELEVQVIETRKRVLGEQHPDTLTSMANLASTYSNQGRWKEAEKLQVQVMDTRKRVLGEEHPSTLTTMNNLAGVLDSQGKRTLAKSEKVLGIEHPDTLTTMSNLALVFGRQGMYMEAESMYRQTLATREDVLGLEYPSTPTTMGNLAFVLYNQYKIVEAAEMNMRALKGYEKAWGAEHTSTLDTVNNLGNLYKDQGKMAEAEKMYQRALDGYEKAWALKHTLTLDTVNNLGNIYANLGKLVEAENAYQRALKGYEVTRCTQ